MLFERIESKGLAHYSYIIGDDGEALVIDPRRDCEVYVEMASREGQRIAHILETHRNEDFVVGSVELAARTGAEIWRADAHLEYRYGRRVEDGQALSVGRLRVKAIHSPGHTLGSMSYLLHDPDGAPWVVFTGDALFAGEVGRVDFMGRDRLEEMAGLLYETLFDRLLPLGDEVIVCPAHGSGSVCGSAIAERVWTTIGLERRLNPRLQFTARPAFIANTMRELDKAPYFRQVEALNLSGAPILGRLPVAMPLSPEAFAERAKECVVVDTRTPPAFGAAHVPGALSIWEDGLPSYAGWFLPPDRPILLVGETNDVRPGVRYLIRLGYDDLAGCLSGGMLAWLEAGLPSAALQTAAAPTLAPDGHGDPDEDWILDVRSDEERDEAPLLGATPIPLKELSKHLEHVPKDRSVTVTCGMGLRAMVAASFLRQNGWDDLTVVLGSLAG